MPQMMPINWIISFIFFLLTFLTFIMMNYYILNFNNKMNSSMKLKKIINNLTWKW
uniref:ATP synthase F0 subunit 8 n=1 Tax=Promustilia yajiangensis TaxID=3015557 RepID=UPI0027A780AA|nr:ATP synthase F0 subunit 8 [Promustilia yajiangensis]WGO62302.1 ATP synthase F0 subunit 8 [Promustilia yajiangensis]